MSERPDKYPVVREQAESPARFSVEGDQERDPLKTAGKPDQKKDVGDIIAELAKYRVEAEAFIETNRPFFANFAQDVSLRFILGDKFFIDLQHGEVHAAVQWFYERGFSREQIRWAFLHELSHFRDLREDPQRMMENFDYIRRQAKKTGAIIERRFLDVSVGGDPEAIAAVRQQYPSNPQKSHETMSACDKAAFRVHHLFYNIFDDIYVNNTLRRRVSRYEPNQPAGEEVRRLYKEKLFKETDYTKLPRHLQFAYALLRKEMIPDEEIVLGPDAKEALSRPVVFKGKKYTAESLIKELIKPRRGRDTKAGTRYAILQKTLEPIYEELLAKDIAEWQPSKPEAKNVSSDAKPVAPSELPFKDEYDKFDEVTPDQFKQDEIEAWVRDVASGAINGAGESAPEDIIAEARAREEQAWCEKYEVDPMTLRRFRALEKKVEPYGSELSALWRKIIYGSAREVVRQRDGFYATGEAFSIPRIIEEFPKIQTGRVADVRAMERTVSKEQLVSRPDLIRVRLVGDISSSMNTQDKQGRTRRQVLEECSVLLVSSIREFNTHLNLTRRQSGSKLTADTEMWTFGQTTERTKRFRKDAPVDDEQVEMLRIFTGLSRSEDYTLDNIALERIEASLTADDKQAIADKKTMEIVFEITDGVSGAPPQTIAAINKLTAEGVIVRAFQIAADPHSAASFNAIWNRDSNNLKGVSIGSDIGQLLPALVASLKQFLGDVRL